MGLIVGGLLFFLASTAFAAEYEYCARGVGDEFTKTIRVRLSIDGPDTGQLTGRIAGELINRLVWKERAREVFVEPYDQVLCEAALGETSDISISVTKQELDQFAVERDRGPGEKSPTAQALANRAKATVELPSKAPPVRCPMSHFAYSTPSTVKSRVTPSRRSTSVQTEATHSHTVLSK